MLKITSRDNPRVKQARGVRDGAVKDSIFVEGWRLAEEVLRSGLEIKEIFVGENATNGARARKFFEAIPNDKSYLTAEISESVFDTLSDTKTAQGIVLIAQKPATGKHKIEASLQKTERVPLVVMLHRIGNPSNLGAILRTAEAAGAAGVVLTGDSADVFSPKSLRGAMGAAFRLPLWTKANFFDALDWAFKLNLTTTAADVRAEKNYLDTDWNEPRMLIFGSEAHGLNEKETTAIDELLTIPMENAVESLNLAVSAGVILFEAKRQTGEKSKS